jgi:hypothetical protein
MDILFCFKRLRFRHFVSFALFLTFSFFVLFFFLFFFVPQLLVATPETKTVQCRAPDGSVVPPPFSTTQCASIVALPDLAVWATDSCVTRKLKKKKRKKRA